MNKIIVTTGQRFTDIDALACALSYTELLTLKGIEAYCVLPGVLNKSLTQDIKNWDLKFLTKPPRGNFNYVLVDISEPKFFADFVDSEKVIELYDHHEGFEKYWQEKLGKDSHIEKVGSCTTLIWERFREEKLEKKISTVNANLFFTTTFSHTLNFKSSVTNQRDLDAFNEIKKYTKLPNNWIEKYFENQEKESLEDSKEALLNDTKVFGEGGKEIVIGQLEFWDSRKFLTKNLEIVESALKSFGKEKWFLTSPSISEGKNYLFTKNNSVKNLLEKTIGATFNENIGITEKLWLRKEILAKIQGF